MTALKACAIRIRLVYPLTFSAIRRLPSGWSVELIFAVPASFPGRTINQNAATCVIISSGT
jgi:hypothetical protein